MFIMKNHSHLIKLFLLLFSFATFAQVKIGDNPSTIGASSALELESATKALLITRVANTAAITSPVNGMLIYDISASCIKGYQNGAWTNCVGSTNNSNGTGVVSAYSCSTASAGSLIAGTAASGATQTITATVITVGTYNISASANGVTFAASGTFAGTGAQNIVLTATGTPIAVGSNTFTLNTNPNCSFSRTTQSLSSNGTGVVSAYSCSTASAGTLARGNAVSGVTQTITASVTTVGTYSISTTANGVTFAASGTFAGTGAQNIVLTATGTPTTTGSNTFILNTTPNCSFSRTTVDVLPGNITLSPIGPYFIASVYDQDYTPYTAPTAAASLATAVIADGTNEAVAINIQGTITTTGVTIKIPYTVVTAAVTLTAFSQTITIPASYTQDGVSRDLTFSYAGATYPVGSGNVTATLKAVGGTLNVKQLDVQTGLGNDNLGWLLAQFTYATNSSGVTANFAVRDIAGIPDRNIADANHRMLYLPVTAADGKVWLNNNLGADYSNTSKASFNPAQQATGPTDYHAHGSSFQWGRYSDGHDLINWTDAITGSPVTINYTSTLATSDTPTHNLFIGTYYGGPAIFDWRNPSNDALWQGVTGTNNPCPIGFRVPTYAEWTNVLAAENITTKATAASSTLKISTNLIRTYASSGYVQNNGASLFWTSTRLNGSTEAARLFISDSGDPYLPTNTLARSYGNAVRCIKDDTAVATISTLTCGSSVVTGTLGNGSAASGVTVAVPYSGGNSGAQYGQSVVSTGVTGLTATLAASIISSSGNFTYTISGTPTSSGTASFAISVGGQSCTLAVTVGTAPANPTGAGALAGTTCFDVAISNDNANGCGALSGRTAQKANFTQSATNTQTYTFTPSGTVSNVRFVYINTNGTAITALTGGNSGNNISTAVTATVTYASTLNTAATGLTNSNAITSDIYVVYNNGATNNGTDVQIKITASIKDCACCGAFVAAGVYKSFLCHNLGADTSLDPNVPVVGIQGAYIQWGRRGPNTTGDARVDWQTAANTSNFGAAPNATNANADVIAGWSTTAAADYSWRTVGGAKTANDPCPAGYRVPTQAEWTGVNTYNTASRTGIFTSADYYGSAIHFGPNASTKLLTLPVTGSRTNIYGAISSRGYYGFYWSSTESGTDAISSYFGQTGGLGPNILGRTYGNSLRCIAE